MKTAFPCLALGLMSGASADGVDVALIETDGDRAVRFLAADTVPYDDEIQTRLIEAARRDIPFDRVLQLERELTLRHAEAVREVLAKPRNDPPGEIAVCGFHGHTIQHSPGARVTWQLGDASLLAEELGMPVVADFRRRDLAAGGEGAPLAALYHQVLFRDAERPCLVLNLGGAASITWLGDGDKILASDTGPGCGLLDTWAMEKAGMPFDRDGGLALAGKIHDDRVLAAFNAPFFDKLLPKSAGLREFDDAIDLNGLTTADGAATLCALTAESVWRAVEHLPELPKHVWVTGGGANHPRIMQLLAARFAKIDANVGDVRQLGLRPNSMESECVAWLAVRRLRRLPTSIPMTTGCRAETCGGVITA